MDVTVGLINTGCRKKQFGIPEQDRFLLASRSYLQKEEEYERFYEQVRQVHTLVSLAVI